MRRRLSVQDGGGVYEAQNPWLSGRDSSVELTSSAGARQLRIVLEPVDRSQNSKGQWRASPTTSEIRNWLASAGQLSPDHDSAAPISERNAFEMDVAETFSFSVDSALLGELGEKLVSTVHVALSELVKNAYDADATQVIVRIEPDASGRAPTIVVDDDGIGMSLDEVRRYWMKIGTSNKSTSPVSRRFGRLKTGSKGIGRFACRRLGLELQLTTTSKRTPQSRRRHSQFQTTQVDFNWSEFKPGIDVEEIGCSGSTFLGESGKTGTVLKIWGGLVDEWRVGGFEYLKRQLAGMAANQGAARKGFETDPGFRILLRAPGFSETLIDLRKELIDASWGTLRAEVKDDGRAICKLTAKGIKGTQTFASAPKFKSVFGAKLELGILPVKKDEARKPSVLSQYVVQTIVTEWGGVQVRFNGFRMFPYGDSRDDWLEIERDRARRLGKPGDAELFAFATKQQNVQDPGRSLLNMLSMRNYLGQVDVTSEIKGLTPRIDRQGFVENDAFKELRDFARFAIDWANIQRDNYIQTREDETAAKARREIAPLLNLENKPADELVAHATAYLRKEIKRIVERLPASSKQQTEDTLLKTLKAIEATNDSNTKQLSHLRLVASASTLTLLFAHEVRTIIGTLGAAAARLDQLSVETGPSSREDLGATAVQLRTARDRFNDLIKMTGIVGSFKTTDTLAELNVSAATVQAIRCFQLLATRYNIEIRKSIPTNVTTSPMVPGELYTVLLNSLSNSIKSVIASGSVERCISVEHFERQKRHYLTISDNGIGLAKEHFGDVFTPFISDPSGELYDLLAQQANSEDQHIFGTGSGLGLSITRDILRARGGDARFVETVNSWSATLEIMLP